jgi:hypothetical protein
MKKTLFIFCTCMLCSLFLLAQNVGIKTTNPLSALDINGDLSLRKGTLTLPTGGNNNVDINTNKYSVYDFAGGALTGGAQIYGFTGGTDGRIVTIFNNSTASAIQIMDESHPGSPSSAAANRIVTGSGNAAVIYQNGSATMRYDGQKQRWTIIGSNYTDGLSAATTNVWATSGSNIYNSNTGNIGVNKTNPTERLDVNGNVNVNGQIKINGNAGLANQVLMKNNSNQPVWTDISEFKSMVVYDNPATAYSLGTSDYVTSFTVPVGVTTILVECWGGGGGGGYKSGGGAGGYITAKINVTAGASVAVQVGAGGNYTINPTNGVTGGNSVVSIAGSILYAYGGIGSNSGTIINSTLGSCPAGGSFAATGMGNQFLGFAGGCGNSSKLGFTQVSTTEFAKIINYGSGGDAPLMPGSGGKGGYELSSTSYSQLFSAEFYTSQPGGGGGADYSAGYAGKGGRVIIRW